jgi:hypothetical protein
MGTYRIRVARTPPTARIAAPMMDVSMPNRGTEEARVPFAKDGTVVDATSGRWVARFVAVARWLRKLRTEHTHAIAWHA